MPVKELPLPPGVVRTPEADEILRVFINSDKLLDCMFTQGFDDAAAWGRVFATVARHVAFAYSRIGDNEQQALARIRQSFMDETAQTPGGSNF